MLPEGIEAPRGKGPGGFGSRLLLEKEDTVEYTVRDLLSDRQVRWPLTVCVTLMALQQLSGINNAFNYSSTFLARNGLQPEVLAPAQLEPVDPPPKLSTVHPTPDILHPTPYTLHPDPVTSSLHPKPSPTPSRLQVITLISVSMNVGNVLIVLVSSFFMDRLGRRPLLLMSVGGMGCACLLLTLALVLGSNALVCVAVVRRAWPRWSGQGRLARSGPCGHPRLPGSPRRVLVAALCAREGRPRGEAERSSLTAWVPRGCQALCSLACALLAYLPQAC